MFWNELTESSHMAMAVAYAVMKTRGSLVNYSVDIFDDNYCVIHLDDNNYVTCKWADHKYTATLNHFNNDDYDCEPVNKVLIEAPCMEPVINKVATLVIEHDSSIESIIGRLLKK